MYLEDNQPKQFESDTIIKELNEFVSNIPTLPDDQNYWLVRGDGGTYYEDFFENSFIGIDSHRISLNEFTHVKNNLCGETQVGYKEVISDFFTTSNSESSTSSRRIYTFLNEMKEHDIILTPSKSSKKYLIGFVGKLFEEYPNFDESIELHQTNTAICPFNIRRKITWFKEVYIKDIDLKFHSVRNNHNTILNVEKYANQIDPLLFPFYFKNSKLYTHYAVNNPNDITLDVWTRYQKALHENIGAENAKHVVLKQRVQSIGDITLIQNVIEYAKTGAIWVSIAFSVLGLSKMTIKYKDYNLKGVIPWYFYRKELRKSMELDNQTKEAQKKSIELDNDAKEQQIQLTKLQLEETKEELMRPSVAEQVPEMSISVKDAGRIVLPLAQTQTDSCDLKGEVLFSVQEEPKVEQK